LCGTGNFKREKNEKNTGETGEPKVVYGCQNYRSSLGYVRDATRFNAEMK